MKNKEKWVETIYCTDAQGNLKPSEKSKKSSSYVPITIDCELMNKIGKKYIKGKLLDLGCGNVPFYSWYKDFITENICMDWEDTYHKNDYLDVVGDISKDLPFSDNEFNTIISSSVLEHIYDPVHMLKECHRVLKEYGYLIITTDFCYWEHEIPFDYLRYTQYFFKKAANDLGFEIIETEQAGDGLCVMADIAAKISMTHPKSCIFYFIYKFFKILFNFYHVRKKKKIFPQQPLGYRVVLQKKAVQSSNVLIDKVNCSNSLPLVSICALSYNHSKFIKESVESFWNQKYRNIEIIVLDDGSSDNSTELLEELSTFSPFPMKVLKQKNTGNIPKNFNKLLLNAKGEYVSMISLDDTLTENSIIDKLEIMEKDINIAFAFDSKYTTTDSNSDITGVNSTAADGLNSISWQELYEKEYHTNWTFLTQGSLFRMKVIKEIGYYDEDMISDDDVLRMKLINYLKNHPNEYCKIFSTPTCNYRQHSSNISHNLYNNALMLSQVFDRYFKNRPRPLEYKKRVQSLIPKISFKEFLALKCFENENKNIIHYGKYFYTQKFKQIFRRKK